MPRTQSVYQCALCRRAFNKYSERGYTFCRGCDCIFCQECSKTEQIFSNDQQHVQTHPYHVPKKNCTHKVCLRGCESSDTMDLTCVFCTTNIPMRKFKKKEIVAFLRKYFENTSDDNLLTAMRKALLKSNTKETLDPKDKSVDTTTPTLRIKRSSPVISKSPSKRVKTS